MIDHPYNCLWTIKIYCYTDSLNGVGNVNNNFKKKKKLQWKDRKGII